MLTLAYAKEPIAKMMVISDSIVQISMRKGMHFFLAYIKVENTVEQQVQGTALELKPIEEINNFAALSNKEDTPSLKEPTETNN